MLSAALTIGVGTNANLHADECGPPPPLEVDGVCGQTLMVMGWQELDGVFAAVVPDVTLRLIDTKRRVVAEVRSDARGEFRFKQVVPGTYRLDASGYSFDWPITVRTSPVTVSRTPCTERIYAYMGQSGWPCRSHATKERPAKITR